jgi:hypothetical protein
MAVAFVTVVSVMVGVTMASVVMWLVGVPVRTAVPVCMAGLRNEAVIVIMVLVVTSCTMFMVFSLPMIVFVTVNRAHIPQIVFALRLASVFVGISPVAVSVSVLVMDIPMFMSLGDNLPHPDRRGFWRVKIGRKPDTHAGIASRFAQMGWAWFMVGWLVHQPVGMDRHEQWKDESNDQSLLHI